MLVRICIAASSFLLAAAALAQDGPATRLDAVQKSGELRVCTPGDYEPFGCRKADGPFEGMDVDFASRRRRGSARERSS